MFGKVYSTIVTKPKAVPQAPTPMPAVAKPGTISYITKSGMEMITSMIPGCCALKTIRRIGCLGNLDEISKKAAEDFDKLTQTGKADDGNWNTYGKAPETIAILTTSGTYHSDKEETKRQAEFLKAKGWYCLASFESKESGGTCYIWASPGIKPGEVNCDRKK